MKYGSLIVLNIFILWGCQEEKLAALNELIVPDSLSVGESLTFGGIQNHETVIVNNGTEIFVLKAGSQTIPCTRAGKYVVQQLDKTGVSKQYSFVVSPKSATNVELLVGAKSIVANGSDISMGVLLAEDNYQNPVLGGVNFTAFRPKNTFDHITTQPHHLVNYTTIKSQTLAGKTLLSAQSSGLETGKKEITEVAGQAANCQVSVKKVIPYADDSQYFTVEMARATDAFGNTIEDGTLVMLNITDPDSSHRKISTYTLNGMAKWAVKNPRQSGNVSLIANVQAVYTKEVVVAFSGLSDSQKNQQLP